MDFPKTETRFGSSAITDAELYRADADGKNRVRLSNTGGKLAAVYGFTPDESAAIVLLQDWNERLTGEPDGKLFRLQLSDGKLITLTNDTVNNRFQWMTDNGATVVFSR